MAKIKNKTIWSNDIAWLERLADELEFIGRPYLLDRKGGRLVQFALPPRRQKKKRGKEEKSPRNKRAESAARHNS